MTVFARRSLYLAVSCAFGFPIGYFAVRAPALSIVLAGTCLYVVGSLYATSRTKPCRESRNHASPPTAQERPLGAPVDRAVEPARAATTVYATPDRPGPSTATRRTRQPRTTAPATSADNPAPIPVTMYDP